MLPAEKSRALLAMRIVVGLNQQMPAVGVRLAVEQVGQKTFFRPTHLWLTSML